MAAEASSVVSTSGTASPEPDGTVDWRVREAGPADAERFAAAVAELLVELGGKPPEIGAMVAAARELIADEKAGTLLLAEDADGTIVGVVAVSWPTAIHAGGTYGLIQDVWVRPAWRGRAVGASLLAALRRTALMRGVTRVEVGLPREGWPGLEATASFYRSNGFEAVGPRMRLAVEAP